MSNKKNIFTAITLLLVLAISLSACTTKEEGVIAKVNGENIRLDDFNKEYEILKNARVEEYGEEILEKDIEGQPFEEYLKEGLFNMLVDEIIISQDLEKLEIGVTEDEINQQIEMFKESFSAQLEEGADVDAEYTKFLEESGFTEEYLRSTIRREIMIEKHRDDFLDKIHLEDEEIEKYFEENKEGFEKIRLSHILLEDEVAGEKVIAKLEEGTDFATLAATESLDTQTAAQGGDFGGYIRRGDLSNMGLAELEEPAFALEVGKHSEVVESALGLHILYLEEKLTTFDELKNDVIEELKYQKYIDRVTELKESAEVKILDKNFKF